ncbi:MAG: Maf family protein, partial [Rhodomicrobium sp.]
AYHIEGLGIHLFSEIRGDYFTILGLPILPVLEELRSRSIVCR